MRLPRTAHTAHPWRIHTLASDFRIEDVWALPTPGGPDDLPRLVRQMTSGEERFSGATQALFALRWKIGKLLGWDGPDSGLGARVRTVRDRLPADLRDAPRGPDLRAVPLTSVYLTDNEWVSELANRTVHTLMHIGWVPSEDGGHRGQMTVLVKPNGLFGKLYMAAIRPLRHHVVDPALVRKIGREWRA
ncbi:DUF2867 domain-containing protein [Streptoalloteichus hindustanus]|uniref:DUF2867 domain-containing protein n=1 Tax=Streptoalloteichus hindustanus TaxID=2017 RepID=A0A1M5I6B8_STRHI|nr:DUF2867 domain-containing protein [Streptoalloteichus hindustanus]SHG23898.1 Protein of unknown function [Streptoalloteichus hindustanus]